MPDAVLRWQLNRAASNPWGVAALAVATFTRLQASPHEWRIRGGAAAFYPFQHPMQQAMLLTELQLPLANMPGQMAGLRLCLDVCRGQVFSDIPIGDVRSS